MRKNGLLVLIIMLMLANVYPVDMKGKFGMGIGTTRFGDLLKPSLFAMRYGITEKILIEPWLDISKVSAKVEFPGPTAYETELSLRNTGLGLQALYAFREGEKSNLYGIGGITFGTAELKSETKYGAEKYTVTSPFTYFVIPIGIGGERFLIDDALSVNINVKCGFAKVSGEHKAAEAILAKHDISMFNFGNSLFTLYFIWYF